MCIFKDDNNQMCLDTSAPMLVSGWEWYQEASGTKYVLQLKPYLETQLNLNLNFVLERLTTTIFTLDMPKFKSSTFYSFLFDNTGQVCLAFGWESESISLNLDAQFEMQDCYKTMLEDLSDWTSTWRGEDAKWIDECTLSSGGGTVSLKSWSLTTSVTDQAVIGGTAADGEGCWKFATWTKWAPYVAQMGINYLQNSSLLSSDNQSDSLFI